MIGGTDQPRTRPSWQITTIRNAPNLLTFQLAFVPEDHHTIAIIPIAHPEFLVRFIHYVHERLNAYGVHGTSYEHTPPVISLRAETVRASSEIRMFHTPIEGVAHQEVLIASIDRSALKESDLWLDAITDAFDQLYLPAPKARWNAVIGPDPLCLGVMGSNPLATLSEGLRFGSIEATGSPVGYREEMPCLSPALVPCVMSFTSYPVPISGLSEKFGGSFLSSQPLLELAILVSILSLFFERPWTVRQEPFDPEEYAYPVVSSNMSETEVLQSPPTKVSLPPWTTAAWAKAVTMESIRSALLTYQEGIKMMDWHPSYALIAFMSALQTLGGGAKGGTKGQIRAALSTCLNKGDVDEIMDSYQTRNSTAHSGILFGPEPYAGVVFRSKFGPYRADPAASFYHVTLHKMEQAVRSVLIHHFSNAE